MRASTTTKPQISNIENIYLNTPGGNYDVSGIAGVVSLEADAAANGNQFTVTTGQAVKLSNFTATSGVLNVLGNTPTSLDLTLNKVGTAALAYANTRSKVDLQGTSLTTANITATGTASNIQLDNTGGKLATLNVAGDKAVVLKTKANDNTIKTVTVTNTAGAACR